jgi:dTMP kinase
MSHFVTVEGGEFVGKTTAIPSFKRVLQEAGCITMTSREPGGTHVGEAIRSILLDAGGAKDEFMHPLVHAALFNAARRQLRDNVIDKFLRENPEGTVILDRYVDSTMVYQGMDPTSSLQLDVGVIVAMHQMFTQGCEGSMFPDITFLLQIPEEVYPSVFEERSRNRGGEVTANDMHALEHHIARQRTYLRLPEIYAAHGIPRRFHIVDASVRISEVIRQMVEGYQTYLRDVGKDNGRLETAYELLLQGGHWAEMDAKWVQPRAEGWEDHEGLGKQSRK